MSQNQFLLQSCQVPFQFDNLGPERRVFDTQLCSVADARESAQTAVCVIGVVAKMVEVGVVMVLVLGGSGGWCRVDKGFALVGVVVYGGVALAYDRRTRGDNDCWG